ncbi:Rrf2 family transcriptional regulator [Pararobbsia alpina]|uniref:Rrf2 family transcriptional regulator n=1 Tax=Pararobbsia alpina TaxID=621374 RepID=UPI0039A6A651
MNTSSRFAVGVHILAMLALHDGSPLSSERIAASVNTNPALIRRLLSMLAQAGLTTAQLGTGGGALLARDPAEIRLVDVYRALEDAPVFALHRERPAAGSVVGRHIRTVLLEVSDRIEHAIDATLAEQTLADIAGSLAQHERARVRKVAKRKVG